MAGFFNKKLLLNKNEFQQDNFLLQFFEAFNKKYGDETLRSSDISQQQKFEKAHKELASISIILAHKFAPHMKQFLNMKHEETLQNMFAEIKATTQPEKMAKNYRKCFDAFIDSSDCVSFKATNLDLLGGLDIKDVFVLTFFAMLTNKRQSHDNILQLICCGLTSSGN